MKNKISKNDSYEYEIKLYDKSNLPPEIAGSRPAGFIIESRGDNQILLFDSKIKAILCYRDGLLSAVKIKPVLIKKLFAETQNKKLGDYGSPSTSHN